MHVTVSACFLIRSADFIYRCIIFLNRTSAIKKYYAPAHAQMRKKKRKVGGFSDSGFKTRCPWHFGHSFASFDVSEKTKTDS